MTYEVDDDQYPSTTVIYIEATWSGYGTSSGSGVLVGRNDILTAAHVIYNAERGGLADDIKLIPSYDPDALNNVEVDWSMVHYYPDFDPDGDGQLFPGDFQSHTLGQTELDIALFTLSEAVGDLYGWMGIDYSFGGGSVGVLGHPGIYGRQPMYDSGFVKRAEFNDSAFIYNADLEVNPGNSGGAVYYDYGNGPFVVGLVSTTIAAVSVGGHEFWLSHYMRDNDVAIGGGTFNPEGTDTTDIQVTAGDNIIFLERGNEVIDALEGTDTVVLGFAIAGATVSINANGSLTVVDRNGQGGTDSLINVELLNFNDRTLDMSIFSSLTQLSNDQFKVLAEMYVAYFNRAPDAEGLFYWADTLAEGRTIDQIAERFFDQDETRALYTDPSDTDAFVTSVYANVLGRTPDADGFTFWKGKLSANEVTQGAFVLNIIEAVKNGGGSSDAAYLSDKTDLGIYFSAIKGLSDSTDGSQVMAIFGDQATANKTNAKTAIDGHYADATTSDGGEFIFDVVGIVSDPFAEFA
jgi:V8-like Glu-specific endopeptidase